MTFPFLTETDHHQLDRSLQDLCRRLCDPKAKNSKLVSLVETIIDSAEEMKLIRPGWRDAWQSQRGLDRSRPRKAVVYSAGFGDTDKDEVAGALLALFVAMVQFFMDAEDQEYKTDLTNKLQRYLRLRGRSIPHKRTSRPISDELNIRCRDFLRSSPAAKRKEVAKAIGCSERKVSDLPAWKAVREERKKGRKPKSPRVVRFSEKMEATVGKPDEELQRLIEEQEQDYESSPLDDDQVKRKRHRKRL